MRISDWSSDVCSSDLRAPTVPRPTPRAQPMAHLHANGIDQYYEVHGEGPPLVLVAGMGGTANYWGDQVPALRERRSDKRRVGQECVSKGSSRWSPYPVKNK